MTTSPGEIVRWVLDHSACRIPPDDDYDPFSLEEEWRTAIMEEQEGLGGGMGGLFGH
jgi:hypothetical protein